MHIDSYKIQNYKNLQEVDCSLNHRINCFVGANGMGKTNFLDAVYYCCMGKSFFSARDTQVLREGSEFIRLDARLELTDGQHRVVCKVVPGKLKEIEIDDVKLERSTHLAGRHPVVMISTQDDYIIREGSIRRRTYLNNILGQLEPDYMLHLMNYHKILRQRNALLKQDAMDYADRRTLAQGYSESMAPSAEYIHKARVEIMPRLRQYFVEQHQLIVQSAEAADIGLLSDISSGDFLQIATDSIASDLNLRRTTRGVHRDDLSISLGEMRMKDYASQGQMKSAVIALKLAQYHVMRSEHAESPIVLLDDIFDRLDEHRVAALVKMMSQMEASQIFISDTDLPRVSRLMETMRIPWQLYSVDHGDITPVS